MPKKKHRSGHCCKVCGEYKSNESFSGTGHAKHICKACSRKTLAEQSEDITLNKLYNMPFLFRKLSPAEKSWLESRLQDEREDIKAAAQKVYNHIFPHTERNKRKKQLHINKLSFRVDAKVYNECGNLQNVNCLFEVDKIKGTILKTEFDKGGSCVNSKEVSVVKVDMTKLLKWIVHSLEIFEWEQDYSQCNVNDELYSDESMDTDDYEQYIRDDEVGKEYDGASETTWQVEIDYSVGTVQKTIGTHKYLPENVDELYRGLEEFFLPPDSEDEGWEEMD